jgi:hypothetical protein
MNRKIKMVPNIQPVPGDRKRERERERERDSQIL